MKKITSAIWIILILCLLGGCAPAQENAQIAVTTLPVYEFTLRLCGGTDISVTQLVTESVSCLHDYTLQADQMRAIEAAQVVILSGAGLEGFLDDALNGADTIIDASDGIGLLCGGHTHEQEEHEENEDHHGENDPHIWLSPQNAKIMAQNICTGLSAQFPAHKETFENNLAALLGELDALQAYGEENLAVLQCRELITFHDGFAYLAESFDLEILEAVEEESGSEAAASELIGLIGMVEEHQLSSVFTETNGSVSAANIIAAETGASIYTLDMAMAGDSYFDAMYHNIDTLKEALG